MPLGEISEHCYNMTQSYLNISNGGHIIAETQDAIKATRDILLNDVFTRWSPLSGEISFSYNGGKDCQVLLLIYLSCLWEFFILQAQKSQFDSTYHKFPTNQLFSVFIDLEETFPSLETFVSTTSNRYSLALYSSAQAHGSKASNMTEAFRDFLKCYPDTQAILLGVRSTDPFGDTLKPIQKTDSNWPDFYRIQPLLQWKLANIWSYLLYSSEPICCLYSLGFTSLGSIDTTLPNPYLIKNKDETTSKSEFEWEIANAYNKTEEGINLSKIDDRDEKWINNFDDKYLAGWCLLDDSIERAGRTKKSK